MEEIKIEYEVEKSNDREGGRYFDSLEEAVKYYTEEIIFCMEQIKEHSCDDFEIFESMQINKHTEDEVNVIMFQRIPNINQLN